MLKVFYEDQDVIVVKKPVGTESQAVHSFAPDMVSEIKKHIHRLSTENGEKIIVGTDDFTGNYNAKLLVELYKNYNVRAYAINSLGVSYDDMKLARGGSISPR